MQALGHYNPRLNTNVRQPLDLVAIEHSGEASQNQSNNESRTTGGEATSGEIPGLRDPQTSNLDDQNGNENSMREEFPGPNKTNKSEQ